MNKIVVIIGIVVILLVSSIFALKSFIGNSVKEDKVKEFTVNAFRFGYSPETITVNKGDKVKIIINNTDTLHGIRIPDLNLKDNNQIEFTADKQGEFTWYCANMCGKDHMQMKGTLKVIG